MQTSAPTPTAPSGQATTVQTVSVQAPPAAPSGPYSAREMYEAAQLQRRILRDQLNGAEAEREEIAQQLRQPDVAGVDKSGLEQRLRVLDTRVLDLQNQLSDAQTREAQAAAVPGATQELPGEVANERFEMFMVGGTILTLFLGFPIVIAYARRLWKKAAVTVSMTPELDRRLDAIDRTLEATALEVERIGEGQRFVTQMLAGRTERSGASLPSRQDPT